MSGHNRWSKLKRAKAVSGVAKGKLWDKLIKELTMASRLGGGDPRAILVFEQRCSWRVKRTCRRRRLFERSRRAPGSLRV